MCQNLFRVHVENEQRFLYCRMCNTKTKTNENLTISSEQEEDKKEVIVITESEQNVFPLTEMMCPQCNEMRQAEWTMQQTRGGDEPPTRFYQCKTCNWRWREYN